MSQSAVPEIVIFGATHVGLKLANLLAKHSARVLLIDRSPSAPETPAGWEYACGDFTALKHLCPARPVYAVTDEDDLNIQIALAVRNQCPAAPIVITLVQSRLGKKLARQLEHFSFISPPELAAQKFVDAIYAPRPEASPQPPLPVVESEPEVTAPWRIDPLVLRAICLIGALAVLASIYFHFAERLSWIDSVYFVITLMATVGFGDISLRSSSTVSKLVGIALMIASVTNTAVIFALITDSLLRHRLALAFGRRRVKQSGHVLVVGIGSVGLKVVEELIKRGEPVVAIDAQANGRYLPAIYAKRVPTLIGDATFERTLRDGGLLAARALVSVTNHDLTNLEVGLNAKLLKPEARVVLRIYDPGLAQSLREHLDIHFALSMSTIAAEVLAQFAEAPPQQ